MADSTGTGRTTVSRGKSGIGRFTASTRKSRAPGRRAQLRGADVHQRLSPQAKAIGAILLGAIACVPSFGGETGASEGESAERTVWRGPGYIAQIVNPPNVPPP